MCWTIVDCGEYEHRIRAIQLGWHVCIIIVMDEGYDVAFLRTILFRATQQILPEPDWARPRFSSSTLTSTKEGQKAAVTIIGGPFIRCLVKGPAYGSVGKMSMIKTILN
jgi:hypothetical protein